MSSRPSTAAGSLQDGGYQLRDLTGHKQPVSVVAWASNGRRLASGSDDGTVRLWNVEHQPPVRSLHSSLKTHTHAHTICSLHLTQVHDCTCSRCTCTHTHTCARVQDCVHMQQCHRALQPLCNHAADRPLQRTPFCTCRCSHGQRRLSMSYSMAAGRLLAHWPSTRAGRSCLQSLGATSQSASPCLAAWQCHRCRGAGRWLGASINLVEADGHELCAVCAHAAYATTGCTTSVVSPQQQPSGSAAHLTQSLLAGMDMMDCWSLS